MTAPRYVVNRVSYAYEILDTETGLIVCVTLAMGGIGWKQADTIAAALNAYNQTEQETTK